jgi:putative addiction module component (TIGR02574 family)
MMALNLPESDRAKLASGLLDSLPGVLVEDDDGLAEAIRRSEEMDRDPSACLTHEEFLKSLRSRE